MRKHNYHLKSLFNRWLCSLIVMIGFCTTNAFSQVSQTFNSSGSFLVPAGVTTLTVECWGGGGGGGGVNVSTASGGGGGGAYSMSSTVAVTPGNTYTVTVGAGGTVGAAASGGPGGDSWFGSAATVMAKGGNGGIVSGAAGTGGSAGSSIGTTKFNGGNGANGSMGNYGGGGGGGAGTGAVGGNAVTSTGGAGGAVGGGAGANGPTANNPGNPGNPPGGGGSGARTGAAQTRPGGAGGAGQVIVTYTPPGCTGTPVPGSTQSTASPVCPTTSFTLSFNGTVSGSGITYQWQSSPDNIVPYSNISAATNATYATTQATATYYRCEVTCSGNTGTSTSLPVTMSPLYSCYCLTSYGNACTSNDIITNVVFATINNPTGCTGSAPTNNTLYNTPNPTLLQGVNYPITVGTGINFPEGINVWIDYNKNGVFETTESVFSGYTGNNNQVYTGSVTIPMSATLGQTYMRVRCRYNNAMANNAACTNFNFGESEDYLITIAAQQQCSGTPNAGTTVSTANPVCPAVSFTLSMNPPSTDLGLTYQWQSSPNGSAWGNVSGTAATYATTQTSDTYYRCIVTCTNGGASSTSVPLLVTMGNPCQCITYCTASQTTGVCSVPDEHITNVTFNTINNNSTCAVSLPAGYTNYTGISTNIQQGQSYPFSFTNGGPFTGDFGHVFFDWNADGDWADAGEDITLTGSGTNSAQLWTGTITVPLTSVAGGTRMRARVYYTTFYGPCGAADYGEAEDYCINILPAAPCSGAPAASSTGSSANPACYNTAFTLSLGTNYPFSGITYQWQSAPDLSGVPGTFGNISGATTANYVTAQTSNKWYHCIVTCTNGGQSITSSNLLVTTQLCYCISEYTAGCSNDDKITNFAVNTLSNNSGAACVASPPGYVIYPPTPSNLTTTMTQGVTYTATITETSGNTAGMGVAIWIDYNDNGVFDATENSNSGAVKIGAGSTSGSGTVQILIPAGASSGLHRMRVKAVRNTAGNVITACTTANANGETEDYTVTIGPQVCIASPSSPSDGITICPSAFSSLSWNSFGGATGYDVYFGTSNPATALVSSNQPGTSYNPGPLAGGTTYYWSVVPVGPGGSSCSTWSFTLKPGPDPLASSNAPVCTGSSLTLFGSNNASGQSSGNSWSWSGPSFTSPQQNPIINGATAANAGTYTLTVTNSFSCTATSSHTVAVNPNPVLSIATQTNVSCNGVPDGSVDIDASNGTPAYLFDLDGNSTIDGIYSGLAAGTYTVSVIDDNGCEASPTLSVVITEPEVLTVSAGSNSPVCSGTAINLNSTPGGGTAGYSYAWTGPNGPVPAVQNPTISSAATADGGQYDLEITDAHGCTASSSITVSVSPEATVSAGANQGICAGTTATMAGSFGGGASSATWSTSGTGSFNNNSPTAVYTPSPADVTAGSVLLTYTTDDPSGPCPFVDASMTLTISAAVTVSAGPDQTICTGTTATMAGSFGGAASSATWSSSGTGSFNNNNPNAEYTPSGADVTAGSVILTYTTDDPDGPCTSLNSSMTLTIIAAPTAAISNFGNNNICLNQPATVTLAFTGTGPWNYTVSDGLQTVNGSTPTSPVNINITPTTAGSHNYTITAISDANCPAGGTSSGTATVFVSTAPPTNNAGPVTTSSPEACSGTVLLVNTTAIAGQNIRYSWNTGSNSGTVLYSTNIGGPFSPAPFQTTSPTVYAQFGALAGSSGYSVCVQGVNGCGSTNNKCSWVRGIVSVPGTITPAANAVACANDIKNYSCGTSAGATIYNWTLAGSATPITSGQGTQNVTVTFPAVFTSGQLCVSAALACGGSSTSAPRCMLVSNIPAVPGTMTGPAKVCPGASGVVFSVPGVTGATGYSWTVPAGCTITSGTGTNSIQVSFPNPYTGAPPVCVSATSACASSVARCKTVGSNVPGQPGAITGPTANICNSTVQYSVPVVANATSYNWTNPAGTTISSGQGSTTILLNVGPLFTSGPLTVVASTLACTPGNSPARTITITGKPNQPGTITANPVLWCTGGFVNFSVSTVSPLPVYNWTTSNGTITAGQGSDNIDVTWGATAAGTVNVTAGNTCGTSTVRSQPFSSGCREEGKQLAVGSQQLAVYPNPAHDKVTVSIYVKESSDFTLQLMDVSGRVVLSQAEGGTEGLNTYDLNVTHLSKGVYMLEVKTVNDNWKTMVAVE